MGLSYSRDAATGIITVSGDAGTRLSADPFGEIDARISAEFGQVGLRLLYDLRGLDTGGIGAADLQRMADADAVLFSGSHDTRVAVVAGDSLEFGQGRQYQIISEPQRPFRVGVFTDVDVARAWLLSDEGDAAQVGPGRTDG